MKTTPAIGIATKEHKAPKASEQDVFRCTTMHKSLRTSRKLLLRSLKLCNFQPATRNHFGHLNLVAALPRRGLCVPLWHSLGLARWLMLLAACTFLTGCFGFLKPAESTARHFVLTPLPAQETQARATLGVGLGQVKVPPYLFDTSLAVRKGTNEISYLTSALWAERLDNGLQRVLAANLMALLPAAQVRLSAWRSEEVSAEVYVSIQQFDVDTGGHAVLVAWWRVLSPGGEKTLRTGETRLARSGPPPDADPSGAVAALSQLVGDFSRQLAEVIKETSARNAQSNRSGMER